MKFKNVLLIVGMLIIASCGFLDDEDGDDLYMPHDQPSETESTSDDVQESAPDIDAIMADYSDGPGGAVMVIQDC